MSGSLRLVLAAAAFAALAVTPRTLPAQATAAGPATPAAATTDSLAFPRQFVQWVFKSQGDSAFAHAGPDLRNGMKSPAGVNEMASRIQTRFGDIVATDAEVQFDDGALKVYIVAMRFDQAPQPGAWVVAYSPTTLVVERASFTSLANVKARYPQAKLP
jgi:hypothetical protein